MGERPNIPMSILLRNRLALFVITICAAGYWMHIVAASPTVQFSAVAASTYVENDLCKNRITFPSSKPGEWGIGSTLPLYVCAKVRGTKNWLKVTGGKIKVVNVTGKASLTPGPPPNASMFRDAQAYCRALKTGMVRFETTFKGMKGSGHLEIVTDDY